MLWKLVSANGQSAKEAEPSYSVFLTQVNEGDIKDVRMYLSPNSYELQGEYNKPPPTPNFTSPSSRNPLPISPKRFTTKTFRSK